MKDPGAVPPSGAPRAEGAGDTRAAASGRPAVVVHDAAQAEAALRLATGARGVLLLSAAGAAASLGAPWFLAMIRAAEAAAGRPALAVLDCGDAPGLALAALRDGARLLVLDRACPAWPMVEATCRAAGATLWPAPPAPAFDMRGLDLRRPAGRTKLAAWLAHGPGAADDFPATLG